MTHCDFMVKLSDLSSTERAEYVDRVLADLDGLKNLGPEYFKLRTRLVAQTGQEFLTEVEARHAQPR